jgi:signal transduction histidine kinase
MSDLDPNPTSPKDDTADVIERLKAENTELKLELEQTRLASQRYLQNVAHQLTAPLGAIKWSIEGLKDAEVPMPRKVKLLSSIYSQATILVHLIKNFTLMSNLEADLELDQFRDKPERVDVFRLAVNLANDFQPQAAETGKKIIVDEMSFTACLGSKSVLMVKNLVAQALSNLLENAVKYADFSTTISVTAGKFVPIAGKAPVLGISVISTGMPITSDEVSQLCSRGFRGTAAKQKVPAGTGIGLYLAKRVMTLHQGTLIIKAKAKESRFILVFPLDRLI